MTRRGRVRRMRRGLALLPLGLLLLAFAEIAVFSWVVHSIGALLAVVIAAASSVTGLILLRREGIRGWRSFRAAAEAGRPAGREVSHSLVGLLGALLLAVPGFITAVAGLLLVVPPGRIAARIAIERFTERRVSSTLAGDLFGPRHVRVHQDAPVDPTTDGGPVKADVRPPAQGEILQGEVVEGDIVR
jgi:UPF0716 protein FxsA